MAHYSLPIWSGRVIVLIAVKALTEMVGSVQFDNDNDVHDDNGDVGDQLNQD